LFLVCMLVFMIAEGLLILPRATRPIVVPSPRDGPQVGVVEGRWQAASARDSLSASK
jgi:hypothetical protein